MARIIECPCGHQLTGRDDDELCRLARQHVTEHHPDAPRTDDEIRSLVRERARDV